MWIEFRSPAPTTAIHAVNAITRKVPRTSTFVALKRITLHTSYNTHITSPIMVGWVAAMYLIKSTKLLYGGPGQRTRDFIKMIVRYINVHLLLLLLVLGWVTVHRQVNHLGTKPAS